MNLHEFQAKEILSRYAIQSPPFKVIQSREEFSSAWDALHLTEGVLKIQIHAGGRGKAGGIKIVKSKEEGIEYTNELLGKRFVTKQTSEAGLRAKYLILTELTKIDREFYVAITYDIQKKEKILIVSSKGGVEIEETAKDSPQDILTFSLPSNLKPFHHLNIFKLFDLPKELKKSAQELIEAMNLAFDSEDATLIEINPLVLTKNGELVVLDARMTLDDSALFRHPDMTSFFDPTQHSFQEVSAHIADLAYVSLEGSIGCMVNGAGLAMATLDLLNRFGGSPANFLDVGGGSDEKKIGKGFEIILEDTRVKALFVNIFGGIMDCAKIAQALVSIFSKRDQTPPTVVRMAGTNVERAKEILLHSSVKIDFYEDLEKAAQRVIALARGE